MFSIPISSYLQIPCVSVPYRVRSGLEPKQSLFTFSSKSPVFSVHRSLSCSRHPLDAWGHLFYCKCWPPLYHSLPGHHSESIFCSIGTMWWIYSPIDFSCHILNVTFLDRKLLPSTFFRLYFASSGPWLLLPLILSVTCYLSSIFAFIEFLSCI
ncbi:hypothetical protein F5879DRAFT_249213 [Lentinula edodes]|nr:hypothetical protein F5879DRAFT_249213 [Lentinula edodes]